jgi:hypothetical protein
LKKGKKLVEEEERGVEERKGTQEVHIRKEIFLSP